MADHVQDFLDRVEGIHQKIADDVGLPSVVHCRTCGRELEVDPAHCLAHGWPKCCGATMTIDPPEDP